ncbi:MAG: ATP-binding protein [Desulfobacterales bacterium]|jgi:PAS domain S-box-containing protein|nr:ATP-binding protein [Desulfobacterales bacterium]
MTKEQSPDLQVAMLRDHISKQGLENQKLQQQVTQLAALNRFAQEVTRYLSVDEVIGCAHRQIQSFINPDVVLSFLKQGDSLICLNPGKGIHPVEINSPIKKKVGQCLCGIVAETGNPLYSIDIHRDERCTLTECKDAGLTSFAALPLFAGMRTIGVIALASRQKRDFSEQDAFLRTLAAHVGSSLYNAELYEQVRQQADVLKEMLIQHEQMERALEQEASFRKAIVERASEGFCVCRRIKDKPFLHFSVWNDRITEITGYSMEEINRHGPGRMILRAPDGGLPQKDTIKRMLRGEECRLNEVEIIRSDGERRIVSISTAVLTSDQAVPHILAIIQDDTARAASMDALLNAKKFEAAGVMAGGIAHDFNNLLTVILGSISLVREEAGWVRSVLPLLNQAEQSCMQAKDLTMKLITFATGGTPQKRIGNIENLLRDTVKLTLAGTSFQEDVKVSKGLWAVEFDAEQITDALRHVLANAMDASKEGGRIEVQAENWEPPSLEEAKRLSLSLGKFVRVSVRDFGRGIAEEDIHRVFDPYFSTKEKGNRKGMGLGLTTTYSIMKNHGGQVVISSERGAGTTVTMCFPAKEACLETPPAPRAEHSGAKKRILVMEDEAILATLAGNMLSHLGYEPTIVTNGKETCQWYRKAIEEGAPYDAVILDLTIKGGAGAEKALQQLKEIDPGVRAIVSSGHVNAPVILEYSRYGFNARIVKPYTLVQLRETIAAVLKDKTG